MTNHEALKWLLTISDAPGNLARWCLCFAEIEFDIVFPAGIKHHAADALLSVRTEWPSDQNWTTTYYYEMSIWKYSEQLTMT